MIFTAINFQLNKIANSLYLYIFFYYKYIKLYLFTYTKFSLFAFPKFLRGVSFLCSPYHLLITFPSPTLLPVLKSRKATISFYSALTLVARKYPSYAFAQYHYLLYLIFANKFSKAKLYLESSAYAKLQSSSSRALPFLFAKALFLSKTNQLHASSLLLKRLQAQHPQDSNVAFLLATVLSKLQSYRTLQEYFSSVRPSGIFGEYAIIIYHDSLINLGLDLIAQKVCFLYLNDHSFSPKPYLKLADQYIANHDMYSAFYLYKHFHAIFPHVYVVVFNLSKFYLDLYKDYEQSAVFCKLALQLMPDSHDALNIMGLIYLKSRDYESALDFFERSLSINPDFAPACANLSLLHSEQRSLQLAERYIDQALSIDPSNPDYLNSKALILSLRPESLRLSEYYLRRALIHNRHHLGARNNLSMSLRARGHYKLGWSYYSTRNELSVAQFGLPLYHASLDPSREWKGEILQHPHKIFVVGEQGIGDVVQFGRYIQFLLDQEHDVTVVTHQSLHTLLTQSTLGVKCLTPDQCHSTNYDIWVPLLNLPWFFNVSESVPCLESIYLRQSSSYCAIWSRLSSTIKEPIIGLHWQGNPVTEQTNLYGRSFGLDIYSPLASLDIQLLSLQKGYGAEQLFQVDFKHRFVPFQHVIDSVWDFQETLSIISICDLVITNDSGIAHISASLGKLTWLLLHVTPDWRWGLSGTKSGWYDSVRIYRQEQLGHWDSVIASVVHDLQFYLRD